MSKQVKRLPSQKQMFYQERRKIAESNIHFLQLVEEGMTREDLAACIERRPSLWQRFEGWLEKLPSRHAVPAVA